MAAIGASRTDGVLVETLSASTYGLPSSSRYAPTPSEILLGLVSAANASFSPRMGSGGPIGTSATQLYRLLDPTNYRKSLRQLFELLNLLGCDVDVVLRTARPGRRTLRFALARKRRAS